MSAFDKAWQLLKMKRYVPFGHTHLPGAGYGATRLPQESDEDFRQHAQFLDYRDNPAMQRRLREHAKQQRIIDAGSDSMTGQMQDPQPPQM